MGKKNDAFLLSDGDRLRLSSKTSLIFKATARNETHYFDLVQEREMQTFCDRYVVSDRMLGSGAFGKVFMAIEQTARTQLACKIVDLRLIGLKSKTTRSTDVPRSAEEYDSKAELKKVLSWVDQKQREIPMKSKLAIYFREFEILSSISHPNIIALDKVLVTNDNLYIFQELITAGDLFSYLHSKNNTLMEVEAAVIVRQILVAVEFLHQKNIAHRDLKPENIMMTGLATGARIVLTDFGSARRVFTCQRVTTLAGSEQYGAPEMFNRQSKFFTGRNCKGYTIAADMWSVGVVAALLLVGFLPFDESPGQHNPSLASSGNLSKLESSARWNNLGERPRGFVRGLLVLDENDRMTAKEALGHAWFSNDMHRTDFEALYQRTVKHWRPRVPSMPTIEFVKGKSYRIRAFECSQQVLSDTDMSPKERSRSPNVPVDPPYKPFPRKMHEQGGLWPKRRRTRRMSVEVEEAIARNWSQDSPAQTDSLLPRNLSRPARFVKPAIPLLRDPVRLSGGSTSRPETGANKTGFTAARSVHSGSQKVDRGGSKGRFSKAGNSTNISNIKRIESAIKTIPKEIEPVSESSYAQVKTTHQTAQDPSYSKLTPPVDKLMSSLSLTTRKTIPPVPLNVRSRTKLSSRSRSSSRDRLILVTPSKKRPGSIFDQDYDEDITMEEKQKTVTVTPSGQAQQSKLATPKTKLIHDTWAHSEHLRVNDEDIE